MFTMSILKQINKISKMNRKSKDNKKNRRFQMRHRKKLDLMEDK